MENRNAPCKKSNEDHAQYVCVGVYSMKLELFCFKIINICELIESKSLQRSSL